MSKELQSIALLSEITNPFLQDRVDSPWQEIFYDDDQINRTAFERCLRDIKAVQMGKQSWGLILHGEPGSGKTHLLHRLRLFTRKDPRTWFIYVPPFPSPNRFWRHLLERFFYDVCQRSKMPGELTLRSPSEMPMEERPGQGPLSQIEEALTRHLMGRPLSSTQELASHWADICAQTSPGKDLFERLRKTFDRLTVQLSLDPDVMKVLRHYLTWHHRGIAYAYLLGRDLPDEDLALFGVKQSLDDEDRAKEAVLTFCHLAGSAFTIILAFDQLEGLQLAVNDLDVLRTYSVHTVSLITACNNLLVLSAVQTYFLDDLKKAIHQSYYARLAQTESVLTLLSRETAKRLIQFRLDTEEALTNYRKKNLKLSPLWPFNAGEIENCVPHGGLSARELIRWGRHRFEELSQRPEPRPTPAPNIGQYWEEEIQRALNQPGIRIDEGVYEDGLLKAFQAKGLKDYRAERGKNRDIPLVLEGRGEKIGISISNTGNMTSLARQLKRLQALMDKKEVNRLVFIRDSRLPISQTAKASQQRLKDLTKRGMKTIRPEAEVYAALTVLRDMWNKAAENAFVIGDTTVSMGELKKWLAAETPRPLQDLIDSCRTVEGGLPEDLPDKLLEILIGKWIIPLQDVAQQVSVPETDLSQWIMQSPDIARILSGPPALIFLNPEAAERS